VRRRTAREKGDHLVSSSPFDMANPDRCFDAIRSAWLAGKDPELVAWEVTKPETINYRTFNRARWVVLRPHLRSGHGLGCLCGKYKRMKIAVSICRQVRRGSNTSKVAAWRLESRARCQANVQYGAVPEEPHVWQESRSNVARPLTPHFRECYFHAALVADDTRDASPLVLAAETLPIRDGPKMRRKTTHRAPGLTSGS